MVVATWHDNRSGALRRPGASEIARVEFHKKSPAEAGPSTAYSIVKSLQDDWSISQARQ
jgi:hypothetical protein